MPSLVLTDDSDQGDVAPAEERPPGIIDETKLWTRSEENILGGGGNNTMAIPTSANQSGTGCRLAERGGPREDDRPSLVIEAMGKKASPVPPKSRYRRRPRHPGQDRPQRRVAPPLPACAPWWPTRNWKTKKGRAEPSAQAKPYLDDPKVGDTIVDEVPPVEMGRIAAQSPSRWILQKVREAERGPPVRGEFQRTAWAPSSNGVVKREEYGNVIVDVGAGEGVLRRNEKIGREAYRNGDRIRCYVKDVRPRGRAAPQIFLSRTAPEFMAEAVQDGSARRSYATGGGGGASNRRSRPSPATSGSRAKIGVISYDNSIDPVGACVGMRGSRVQAVVNELAGRKDRHHPVERGCRGPSPRERASACRGHQGRDRRGCRQDRGRGARRSSCRSPSGGADRKRAPGPAADGPRHRHPDRRKRNPSVVRPSSKSAPSCSLDTLDLDEFFAQLLVSNRGLHLAGRGRLCGTGRAAGDRRCRRGAPQREIQARAPRLPWKSRTSWRWKRRARWASRTASLTSTALPPRCWWPLAEDGV